MATDEMKKCPYCAEEIRAEAIKCRYCGSMLVKQGIKLDFLQTPGYWHRVNEGKKIAGICTGLARQFEAPVLILPLRVFFIVTTLFYGFGFWAYLIFWLLMPGPVDAAEAQQSPVVATPSEQLSRPAPPVEQYPGQSQAAPQAPAPPAAAPEDTATGEKPPPEEQAESGQADSTQGEQPAPEPEEKPTGKEKEITEEEKWGPKSEKTEPEDSADQEKKDLENF